MSLKALAKKRLSANTLKRIKKCYENLLILSIKKAIQEEGLQNMYKKLSRIVPDISSQYSTFKIDTPYIELKVRALHAFQVALVCKAMNMFGLSKRDNVTIVDIGDSSGTHIQYLQALFGKINALSVNLDEQAVKKIENKGLRAIHGRAEELHYYNITVDLFLSFEMLEHLPNPIVFLHNLAINTSCAGFVLTVPYLKQSRVGLHHIRQGDRRLVTAENTHIFELSPNDWRLIFLHSGWTIVDEKIYLQYPQKSWLRITRALWKYRDFEGFYGVILKRDNTWSKLYDSW